ncbi:MAG: hypothetical protein HY305_00475 [Sphingobacteriales bacterium]|nr:hypothetical protein [Sphingobacteriales bacterium]
MFTFILKNNKADIELIITRVLLAIAAVGVLIYALKIYIISIVAALALLLASYFVNKITSSLKITRPVMLFMAAVIVLIGTGTFWFGIVLCSYGGLLRFLQKAPVIVVAEEGITIKNAFADTVYEWKQLSNVIYKNGLLTIDCMDNKLFQFYIDDSTGVNEGVFNTFSAQQLLKAQ